MKPSVLVTMPNYDRMTRYLTVWAQRFIDDATRHGNTIYTLKEEHVTRKEFESYVSKQQPEVIFINGHGAEDRIAGHDNEIILDTLNAHVLKDIMVYALSCQSATTLGVHAVSHGRAKGYIGYVEDFIVVSQPSKTTHPEEDSTAALFLEPSNVIITALSKGYSAQVAAEKGKEAYTRSIIKALNSDVQSDDDKYIPYLMWNRKYLSVC